MVDFHFLPSGLKFKYNKNLIHIHSKNDTCLLTIDENELKLIIRQNNPRID